MSKDINKNELKKLLQISNSYLHDSANLFALAHSNLKELSLKINNSDDIIDILIIKNIYISTKEYCDIIIYMKKPET